MCRRCGFARDGSGLGRRDGLKAKAIPGSTIEQWGVSGKACPSVKERAPPPGSLSGGAADLLNPDAEPLAGPPEGGEGTLAESVRGRFRELKSDESVGAGGLLTRAP